MGHIPHSSTPYHSPHMTIWFSGTQSPEPQTAQ